MYSRQNFGEKPQGFEKALKNSKSLCTPYLKIGTVLLKFG